MQDRLNRNKEEHHNLNKAYIFLLFFLFCLSISYIEVVKTANEFYDLIKPYISSLGFNL